jgi:hypothetical protein
MSIAAHDVRLLEHLMKEEAEALEALSALEDGLRRQVMAHDWANLDGKLREVHAMSEKASQAEQMRAVVYQKIRRSCQAGTEEHFQEILFRVPVEDRGDLSGLHRRVRLAVERLKHLTQSLDAYISSSVRTMDRILEEIFPDRRNRIYTQRGEILGAARPLVVSRSI